MEKYNYNDNICINMEEIDAMLQSNKTTDNDIIKLFEMLYQTIEGNNLIKNILLKHKFSYNVFNHNSLWYRIFYYNSIDLIAILNLYTDEVVPLIRHINETCFDVLTHPNNNITIIKYILNQGIISLSRDDDRCTIFTASDTDMKQLGLTENSINIITEYKKNNTRLSVTKKRLFIYGVCYCVILHFKWKHGIF